MVSGVATPVMCQKMGGTDLHEEGPHRMLESGDRTDGVGKGGLEMGDDVRCRSARRFGRQCGRRTTSRQCRPKFALAQVEPLPDTLPGSVTSSAVRDHADRRGNAAGNGVFEESPQRVGCQAQPSDFIGTPDAEGSPASGPPIAVAAKDPPSANRSALRVALVVPVQIAVAIKRANRLAMRTWRLLESFRDRVPFRLAAAKPALLAHVRPMPRENR